MTDKCPPFCPGLSSGENNTGYTSYKRDGFDGTRERNQFCIVTRKPLDLSIPGSEPIKACVLSDDQIASCRGKTNEEARISY